MSSSSSQRTTTIVQLIILVLVCIGVAAVAYAFGVFTPSKEYRTITVRVDSASGYVTLVYSIPGELGSSETQATTPWERNLTVKRGSEVYVTAASTGTVGGLKCTILLEGKKWKLDSSTEPGGKVFCAGIIP